MGGDGAGGCVERIGCQVGTRVEEENETERP